MGYVEEFGRDDTHPHQLSFSEEKYDLEFNYKDYKWQVIKAFGGPYSSYLEAQDECNRVNTISNLI
jgi:hypothetical protein